MPVEQDSQIPVNQSPKKKRDLKSLSQSAAKTCARNLTKSIITTSLGIVIILGSLFSSIVMQNSWSDSIWGIAMGLGLLFAPDDMLNRLKKFIK